VTSEIMIVQRRSASFRPTSMNSSPVHFHFFDILFESGQLKVMIHFINFHLGSGESVGQIREPDGSLIGAL
jgi:hypothetical protein